MGSRKGDAREDAEPVANDLVRSDAPAPVDSSGVEAGEALGRHLEMHAQLLRAMHASHERLAKALERGDRADLVVQSTDALNRTFRQLHEAQSTLARELLRERRRGPWRTVAAVLVAGAVVAGALVLLHRETMRPLHEEVARLSEARTAGERQDAALAIELRDDGRRLLEAVDQGLAANRVLSNELRAQTVELERMKDRLSEAEERVSSVAGERDALRDTADADAAARAELERELEAARAALEEKRRELVDRDLARTELESLLGAKGAASESSGSSEPARSSEPAPPPEPPEVVAARLAEESRREAVNAFLADAGVIGLRLLRSEGIVDGHLDRALFEIRNEQDFPVGFHDAERVRFRVDPSTDRGEIVLSGGSTVVRGVRSPFPGGRLVVEIPAVARGSYSGGEMAEIVEVLAPAVEVASAPAPVVAPPPPPEVEAADLAPTAAAAPPPPPPFDPAPLLATLNQRLRDDGGGRLEFDRVGGVDAVGLTDVVAHHYGASGLLSKTVVARSCRIEVDDRDREVVFRFTGGHHVTSGREVPFFRGRGADEGVWTYRVRGADLPRWRAFATDHLPAGDVP